MTNYYTPRYYNSVLWKDICIIMSPPPQYKLLHLGVNIIYKTKYVTLVYLPYYNLSLYSCRRQTRCTLADVLRVQNYMFISDKKNEPCSFSVAAYANNERILLYFVILFHSFRNGAYL